MTSGAHEEYLDVDTNTGELFMYYLQTRAFDLESMVNEYLDMWGIEKSPVPNEFKEILYSDTAVSVQMYKNIYASMIGSSLPTALTDAETKDFLNYVKYKQSSYFDAVTEIPIDILDYGKNIIRNGILHWSLFLADYNDCCFMYLRNGAQKLYGLELVDFPCPYDDDLTGISDAKDDYHTYLNEFVLEGDKKKKERVEFKLFLKNYVPVTNSTDKVELQNDFYNQLVSDSIHSHNKNNVISRLAASKRWKRRVLFKTPPYNP